MNTLFQMTDDSQDQPTLFNTAPESITAFYTDGGLMISIDTRLDRQQVKQFCQLVIGIRGLTNARMISQSDTTTQFLIGFNSAIPGIAAKLDQIRRDAYILADTFVKNTPVQTSLF